MSEAALEKLHFLERRHGRAKLLLSRGPLTSKGGSPGEWCGMRPPHALPTARFERNDIIIICETVH